MAPAGIGCNRRNLVPGLRTAGSIYDDTVNSDQQAIRQRFSSALDALVDHVKADRSILAAMLCGSLSHDVVWEKSDIDLMLVTVDDKHSGDVRPVALYADGVNVHAAARAARGVPQDGRRIAAATPSSTHSCRRAGCSTRTTRRSPSCAQRLKDIGARDTELQLLASRHPRAAAHRQGAEVVRHPRRSRLHRAVDPLRGDAAGADRGHLAAPRARPRGDSAGARAESRVLRRHLHRAAQCPEDARGGRRRARRHRRLSDRTGPDAVSARARSSARSRRGAVVPARSRITSRVT